MLCTRVMRAIDSTSSFPVERNTAVGVLLPLVGTAGLMVAGGKEAQVVGVLCWVNAHSHEPTTYKVPKDSTGAPGRLMSGAKPRVSRGRGQ